MRLFGLVFMTGKTYDARIVRVKKVYETQATNSREETRYYRDRLYTLEKALWKRHGEPYTTGQPGNGNVFKDWWCKTCRTPWPCADAQLAAGSMAGDVTLRWGKLEAKQLPRETNE